VRKVIDIPADIRRWGKRPPDVDDARADLQRALGKLLYAHSARIVRTGQDPAKAPAHAIVDVLELAIAAAETTGENPRQLVGALELVLERWAKGEATP
jgi:hypothetical protein